jgi:hypothetical protein
MQKPKNSMRFISDLSKGILGIADSAELWSKLTNCIPDSVLLTPDVRILSPACGHGTELDILAARMLNLGIDEKAVKASMYVIDKYSVFTNPMKNKGYTNVFTEDFLKWDPGMKFDVIVGNPPYRQGEQHAKKIWPDFTSKSLSLLNDNGYIAWVIPTGWLDSNNAQMKKVRTSLTSDYNLISIDRTADQYFDVGTEILSLVANNTKYTGNTLYRSFVEEYTVDLRTGLHKNSTELLIESIERKILNPIFPRLELQHEELSNDIQKEPTDVNRHYVIYSTANRGYSATKPLNGGLLKLGLNVSSSFYSKTTEDNNMPITVDAIGGLMYYVLLEDEEHGKELKSFLSSKLIRFFASVYKRRNSGFCHAVRQSKLPKIDFSKYWTDHEVYSLFGIDDIEQAYIESQID